MKLKLIVPTSRRSNSTSGDRSGPPSDGHGYRTMIRALGATLLLPASRWNNVRRLGSGEGPVNMR